MGALLVVVLLGALAALVVVALPDDLPPSGSGLERVVPPGPAPGGPVAGQGPAPVAAASAEACAVTARTLQAAAEAKRAADGTYPSTAAELVRAGYLSEEPRLRGFELTFDGGRVLVNGLPPDEGCTKPRR